MPLLRGVSFRLERRDRLTLSGRNGSGKTTLLRMLAGETSVDGGELNLAKDVRVALHDQRPPRERAAVAARLRARRLQGPAGARGAPRRARARDGRGRHVGRPRWRPTRPRRRGSSTPAATPGARASTPRCTASASATSTSTAAWRRSPAASSRAPRWPARSPATPTCCCSTSRPTTSTSSRWSGWRRTCRRSTPPSCWWRTTAGSSRRSAPRCWSSRAAARASSRARGTPGARSRRRASWRSAARSRSRRPRSPGSSASSPGSARARARGRRSRAQKKLDKMDKIERDPRDGKALGFAFKPPERSGRVIFEVEDGTLTIGERTLLEHFELWLERGEHVSLIGPNGTGKTTLIHALTGEHELAAGKLRRGHNVKVGLLSQHAEELGAKGARTVLEAASARPGLKPNEARSLLGRVPVLRRGGREAARRALRRRAAAAVAGDPRALRRQRARARRAHQPPRPREPRGARVRAAGVPGLAAADLPRPRAARRRRHPHGRGRGRHAALLRRRLARVPAPARGARGGRADRQARQAGQGRAEAGAGRPRRSRKPSKNQQRQAKRIEAEIEAAEAALAALEEELADPTAWNDPRSAAKSTQAPRAGQAATLQALYAEWEAVACLDRQRARAP